MPGFRNSALRAAQLTAFVVMTVLFAHAQMGVPLPSEADANYVPTLTFDIASVRESGPIAQGSVRVNIVNPPHASSLELTNFPLKGLLAVAYGVGTPTSGGPTWSDTRLFNIQAKSDAAADAQMAKLTENQVRLEKQHALQALLAERFGLKAHMETKESSVYLLVVAKGGPKLKEIKAAGDPDQPKPAAQAMDVKASGTAQGLEFVAQGSSTKAIAGMLVSQVGTPILDKTGLTGTYAFTLRFGRDWSAHNPESWPDIFTAVQEQLGLKLESTKEAVPVLVIDHVDAPSAN